MLKIRVGPKIYRLSQDSAEELIQRIPRPPVRGGEPLAGSVQDTLRDAIHNQEAAELEDGELALLGTVIDAWAQEIAVDAPDVQALRPAIREHLLT